MDHPAPDLLFRSQGSLSHLITKVPPIALDGLLFSLMDVRFLAGCGSSHKLDQLFQNPGGQESLAQEKYAKLIVCAGHTVMTKISPALALLDLPVYVAFKQ